MLLLGLAAAASSPSAWAGGGVFVMESPLPIPDNNSAGVAQELVVSGVSGVISSVTIQLWISAAGSDPMFNGDLYVALTHDAEQSVLLNRVGRRDGFSSGYGDSGFTVTLDDAAAGDVHNYRLILNGDHLIPLSSSETPAALTGTWQPDERDVDPDVVTSSPPRTAGLSVFNGFNPNGIWAVYVSDLALGGEARLDKWSVTITSVPEPVDGAVVAGLTLGAWFVHRRRSRML